MQIHDEALKTSGERWRIETGVEIGPGRSLLVVQHNGIHDLYDDDNDDEIYCFLFGWVLRHINQCRLFNAKAFYT